MNGNRYQLGQSKQICCRDPALLESRYHVIVLGEHDGAATSPKRALVDHEAVGAVPMQMRTCECLATLCLQRGEPVLAAGYRQQSEQLRALLKI